MEHNTSGMFVTVWLGILEVSTGKVIAANAGHDDALICRRNGETVPMKSKHNIVVGAFEEARYTNFEFTLEKGEKILLYTDGLSEATDANDQLFGRERAIQAFDAYKDRDPQGIIEGVRSRVDEFVGEAPQFDDLTMLCLELRDV
jgi:sigma-B regulation protein RsbU (phosphoserine phosphatase)